jgi:Tol biopolymer transport system component
MVYTLWDVDRMQSLWNREVGDPYSKPQWSPDNKHIVIALRKYLSNPHQVELFWIDLQGNETQLTNISEEYKNVYIGNFQFSPNGERIAFWVNYSKEVDNSFQPRVVVLDLKHGTVHDYCVVSNGGDVIWSPDGHQIAFLGPQYSNPGEIIILNIEKHQATIIGKSKLSPVAWMK